MGLLPGDPDPSTRKALRASRNTGAYLVVAGGNYAQGSSREHAAIAPRFLGQIAVLAKSYARIGWQNLINFGILPLEFERAEDYETILPGDLIVARDLRRRLAVGAIVVTNETRGLEYLAAHGLSDRQVQTILAGGVIGYFRIHTGTAEDAVAASRV